MIVVCPRCKTRYQVDPRAIGADGRMVRCAHCSHTWHQDPPPGVFPLPPEPEAPPPAPSHPERVAVDAPNLDGERGEERVQLPALPRRRGASWVTFGWILLLLVLAGGAAAGVWWRDEVVRRWPAANLIYGKIGLAVPRPSDVLRLDATARIDEAADRLVIEGKVTNVSTSVQTVPRIKVELTDERQQIVDHWTFNVSTERLLPGATVAFTTTKPRNPAAKNMAVDFAGPDEP
ncbi:MAG TPA: DUF3426 domain-containing protein [Stellaceae bacterium]|nr:DUF3426 domain-containing protein [Stellaceae bacterium]